MFRDYINEKDSRRKSKITKLKMGSSISAIYDDMDDYSYLCKKYKQKQQGLYSVHHDWLEDLHSNKTKLSYEQYKKQHDKKVRLRKIESLKREIKQKQEELKKLQK